MAHGTTTEGVELLLKAEARASGVALGNAGERICVCLKYVFILHSLISSAEISVPTVAAIFNFKYGGHIFLAGRPHW